MGSIKDRNGMDLTEAEDLKKRWQEYTEGLYKKDLPDPDGVITHLEPDILECEVNRALGSITTNKGSGGDGIPVELFQILEDDAAKVLHSICQQIWKTQQWPGTGKGQFSFQSQRKAVPKNAQTTAQLNSSHMLVKQCTKFSKPSFNSTQTVNFQMFKLDLEKAEEPEIKLPTHWIVKKAREFQKNIYFCFIDYTKAFDCLDHNNLWKILPEVGIPDYLICLLRNMYAGQEAIVRTGQGTTDWFQIGKGVCQDCMLSPCLLTYMQSTSCKMLGWMKHKLESRLPGEISITSDMQMSPPYGRK